jgi:hypothetical protein
MGWKSIGAVALVLLATTGPAVAQGFLTAAASAEAVSPASLSIRVFNNYGVPDDDLLAAGSHVNAIFSDAGVNLSWMDCWHHDGEPVNAPAECRQPPGAHELTLRLQATNQSEGRRFVSMGFSLVNLEEGAPFLATVFVDLVGSISRGAAVDFRLLLGRAIAHEIGHLLLNTSRHADRGLMRADWSRAELRRNKAGDWGFQAEEVETIRASAMMRNRR